MCSGSLLQGLNYFQRGVGALFIQWPMVEICELRCNAKICDFIQVIIAVIQQQSISFKLEKIDNILLNIRSQWKKCIAQCNIWNSSAYITVSASYIHSYQKMTFIQQTPSQMHLRTAVRFFDTTSYKNNYCSKDDARQKDLGARFPFTLLPFPFPLLLPYT